MIATRRALMDEVVRVLGTVDPAVRVYRWRPMGRIELPAIFCWLDPSRSEWADSATRRTALQIVVTVAVKPGDEQLGLLEDLADKLAAVLDTELKRRPPFGGVSNPKQPGENTGTDEFNGVPVLTWEFPLELQVDRLIARPQ